MANDMGSERSQPDNPSSKEGGRLPAEDKNNPPKSGGGCVIAAMLLLVFIVLFVDSVWNTLSKVKLQ